MEGKMIKLTSSEPNQAAELHEQHEWLRVTLSRIGDAVITTDTAGNETRTAFTGQSALDMAVDYQPDFVVLDIGLPDMDSYEVARRLRQFPQLKNLRLIAATGYGQNSDRQRTKEVGFDYYLVKPIDRISCKLSWKCWPSCHWMK